MKGRSRRAGTIRTMAILACAALGALAAACGGDPPSAAGVLDHVHGAATGTSSSDLLLATHYGLLRSTDGGQRWTKDAGLGQEMVGGLVKSGGQFVAALQPMSTPDMKMSPSQESMPGMSMGTASTPNIGFSVDGTHWRSSIGIPAAATVAALVSGPSPSMAWASLLGLGIYESTDGGVHWQKVIPSSAPITGLIVVGQNLIITTASGVFVTDANAPSMPALPQLSEAVNEVVPDYFCGTCVVAALASGGIALSPNYGVTWTQKPSRHDFDEVASEPSAPGVLFGMVPAPGQGDHGLWRSTDGGQTWQKVLDRPLVDHMFDVPSSGSQPAHLLAFEWGITVYQSNDAGATWRKLSHFTNE
jgi:photosystem II stability/assembly factor-like uncharacterized protein